MTVCTICTKTVYAQEMVQIDDKPMHKTCLRCTQCNTILSLGKYAAVSGQYYCKPHFKQLFALKGNYSEGFGLKKPTEQFAEGMASSANVGEGTTSTVHKVSEKISSSIDNLTKAMGSSQTNINSDLACFLCSKQVYPVEAVRLDDKKQVHQGCFKCSDCKATLQIANFQFIEGQLFCKAHQKAAFERANSSSNLARTGSNSNLSNNRLGSTSNTGRSSSNLRSVTTGSRENLPKKATFVAAPAGSNSRACTVCTKTVYPVEQVNLDGALMHKGCFRCQHCNNGLKPGNYAALGGKFYCRPHYKQLFALKGNYDEGFGTRPHKEKWLAKDVHEPATGENGHDHEHQQPQQEVDPEHSSAAAQ